MSEHYPHNHNQLEYAQQIAGQHFSMTRELVAREPFDWSAAEITLRSPAVFTDRLSPAQFEQMSSSMQNGFRHLADVVYGQLGVPYDETPRGLESAAEATYRVSVHGAMHAFQSMVLSGPHPERGGYEPNKEPVVREGVFLASQLFSMGLPEAVEQGFGGVVDTLQYFSDKTQQAQRYIERKG